MFQMQNSDSNTDAINHLKNNNWQSSTHKKHEHLQNHS